MLIKNFTLASILGKPWALVRSSWVTAKITMLRKHFARFDHVLAPARKKIKLPLCIITSKKVSYSAKSYPRQWHLKSWFCYRLEQKDVSGSKVNTSAIEHQWKYFNHKTGLKCFYIKKQHKVHKSTCIQNT